ncbi:F-box protein At3g07870-like [Telopea speciosissima]|uniref:F-box protein At3g07870-like n=1 Tax=Telopea speciosissima TaxID=54955 RepID=UPI001CC47F34|nr:F-box protein At3g07870-like [Telopea speciosissima]
MVSTQVTYSILVIYKVRKGIYENKRNRRFPVTCTCRNAEDPINHILNGIFNFVFNSTPLLSPVPTTVYAPHKSKVDCPIEINYTFEYLIDMQATKILGSCNGLLCISTTTNGDDIFLWNPSTRRHQPITPLQFPNDGVSFNIRFGYGFGYDPISNDYKLLRVLQFSRDNIWHSEVNLYSLSTNSWRRIGDMPFVPIEWKRDRHSNILANSALYWVAHPLTNGHSGPIFIGSFDLRDEEYRELPLPDIVKSGRFTMGVGS